MIVFAMVVWFSMRFIWPLIMQAIEERFKTISEGLAAAEQGQKKLIDAESEASVLVKKARKQASTILDQTQRRLDLPFKEGLVLLTTAVSVRSGRHAALDGG
jgi:F-type H+-transporting ATPase subunit b